MAKDGNRLDLDFLAESDFPLHVLVVGEIPFPHVSSVFTKKELRWLQEGLAGRCESRKHTWIRRDGARAMSTGAEGETGAVRRTAMEGAEC